MAEQEAARKLSDLIRGIHVAMLTTVDEQGRFHSRPMAIQQESFDGELWFFADSGSPKSKEIRGNSRVSVTFANPDDQEYVALSGIAEVVQDREKAKELWSPLIKAWFPEGLDDPKLALLRVRVESAEFWDAPSGAMVKVAGLVKALATGERYEPGENKKLGVAG